MNTTTQRVSLCPACADCPAVEIRADGAVEIGEAPHVATLAPAAWNELVRAIKRGDLDEVA